jgi:hypothetical protein
MPRDPGRTFFVVADTALNGEHIRVEALDLEDPWAGTMLERFLKFDRSLFPLRVVSVVDLRADQLSFAEDPPWRPWWATCAPGSLRLQASPWLGATEHVDPNVWTLDGRRVEFKPWLSIVDEVEALTCGYKALWTLERVITSAPHSFLTTGERTEYRAVRCRVQLQIGAWADLPRCFAAYDETLPETAIKMSYFFGEIRAAYREKAKTLRPHVGSFIPCSLWYGFDLWEPDCVLEITGEPEPGGRPCVVHVLSDSGRCAVRANMQLRVKNESRDAETGRYKEVLTDLGRIVG